ncbi:MAG: Uma2 family endonuclease, partial [Armatimonadetes bacterium]|nr:Uma2 family endonuclease [Armatimonadota bacterium]
MVTQPVPQTKLHSPEEYLALEREAESRSEYLNGEIYALAGTSLNHSVLTANVTVAIGLRLRGKPCRTLT